MGGVPGGRQVKMGATSGVDASSEEAGAGEGNPAGARRVGGQQRLLEGNGGRKQTQIFLDFSDRNCEPLGGRAPDASSKHVRPEAFRARME